MSEQIGRQMRRGISWSLLGAVVTNAMRVVVLAVLGRTLSSADFGVVAAAVSVNIIVYGIRDIGIGSALVQRKDIVPAHITTAFAASAYVGFALAAILFALAPALARLYNIPESADVIRVLALLFFALRGLATTSRMLAQRAMKFRLIASIDAVAFAIGSVASIAGAVMDLGPWALVAGYCVEELLATVLYRTLSPHAIGFAIDRARLRELLHFGVGQTLVQSANVVATYGDNFVVGNALGATNLGYYTRAYDLIKFPSMVFDAIVGNVLFAAFSRMQDDRANLATNFRRVAFVNALVLLPASAALIVLAPDAIELLMGRGWGEMVLPFRILALTILLRTNLKLGTILAQAAGAVYAVGVAYVVYMVLVVGGAMVTIRWGTAGVAGSTAFAIAVVSLHCCALGMRVSGLSLGAFLGAHVPGLVLAGVVAALGTPAVAVLHAASLPAPLIFGVGGIGAVLLCAAGAGALLWRGPGDFGWLRGELRQIVRRR